MDKIRLFLTNNGILIFSVEHPIFTAYSSQDWIYRSDASIDHFPVDNYFYESARTANFWGENIIKYHRTLTTYIDTLLMKGWQIERVIELMPPQNMLNLPGMKGEMWRPMILIISAKNRK